MWGGWFWHQSSPWVSTVSDMTGQQLQPYSNTPYYQKSLITAPPDWPPVCSPQTARQASPCSPLANQTEWHPLTLPFMSCGQWVSAQRHTFHSESCFSVSSGLDRHVCLVSVCVNIFGCISWVPVADLEINRLIVERLVGLHPSLFSIWGELFHSDLFEFLLCCASHGCY